jgi:hypothetical protein
MVTPLDSPWVQKLARAKHHFDSLEFALQQFAEAHPCSTEEQIQAKHRRWVVIEEPADPNVIWSPTFGEFFYNARSALDQLMWAVVSRAKRGTPRARNLSYPIHTDPVEFLCATRESLKALPSDVLTVIEQSQPYNGPATPKFHSLALLNQLGNVDKHRKPNLTTLAMSGFGMRGEVPIDSLKPFTGPVKKGTVLLSLPQQMDVSFQASFDVRFAEGEASYTPARYVLMMIIGSIGRIIDDLQPFT